MEKENIIRYWHAVELLQPLAVPKLQKRSNAYSACIYDTPIRQSVSPWESQSAISKLTLPHNHIWSHTLYAHLYDSRLISEKLNEIFAADQGYRESSFQQTALFAAKFSNEGQWIEKSFTLSSEAWFLGRVLTKKEWVYGFEEDQNTAADQANVFFAEAVTAAALHEFTQWLVQFLGIADFFGSLERYQFRFRCQPVRADKLESEDVPRSSFYLDELARIAKSINKGEMSEPLSQYLRIHDTKQRVPVDDDSASLQLIEQLLPDKYPNGCWPAERHLGLVHSQQLAVNTIMSNLADSAGLQGINGPPGTGKTTLLRDLIAAIITRRAEALAKLPRASDAFIKDGREEANDGGKARACFKLNPVLFGFEIVVASSNNGAVENVTLELPQRDKIDASWLPDAEYFAELGELTSGQPAWGLISGALGSQSRRKSFVQSYFSGQQAKRRGSFNSVADEVAESGSSSSVTINDLQGSQGFQDSQGAQDSQDTHGSQDSQHTQGLHGSQGSQGFAGWLSEQATSNKKLTSEQRYAIWQQAVADFNAILQEENKVRAEACQMRTLIQRIKEFRQEIAAQSNLLGALEQHLLNDEAQLAHLDAHENRSIQLELRQGIEALKLHHACKPGFWVSLFSLWRLRRDWRAKLLLLQGEHDLTNAEFERIVRSIKQLEVSKEKLTQRLEEARREQQRLLECENELSQKAAALARACKADHVLAWLQGGCIGRGDDIELAEPWRIEGWRQARARVFIQALKLHRTFFELEASRMRSNLSFINSFLTGKKFQGLSQEAIRSTWASLFMVVPVLSSTFASFAQSFGTLGTSEIGWLLVDEAGQANPQAAVGALQRSQRAIFVGDPLQLKPIVTVSDAVLEHLRTHYRVDAHWLPNRHSAQSLADEATLYGRMAGPKSEESKTWVGLPLVVHRRCDKPMFELANRIAYGGAMVYGTLPPKPEKDTSARLPTGWIQVGGASEGNWVPEEGKALLKLLQRLRAEGVADKDVSIITPFTDVRNKLSKFAAKDMVYGTIHTMQGKEAAVVIMVLGGNTENAGARNWAVSEPNLLNVAATRAKRRFYVIGDRNDWKARALFCEVMDLLPIIELNYDSQ